MTRAEYDLIREQASRIAHQCGLGHEAEDLVQETALSVARGRGTASIATVARRRVYDRLEYLGRVSRRSVPIEPREAAHAPYDTVDVGKVIKVIGGLEGRGRTGQYLALWSQGWTPKEIAAEHGVTATAVSCGVNWAIKWVKERI